MALMLSLAGLSGCGKKISTSDINSSSSQYYKKADFSKFATMKPDDEPADMYSEDEFISQENNKEAKEDLKGNEKEGQDGEDNSDEGSSATPKDISSITDEEVNQYLSESVFIGDSVMYGFELFCMRNGDGFLGNPKFLAAGCYGAVNALQPISDQSVHPMYEGQQRFVWDSISMMKPKHAFFFFGINDMNYGMQTAYDSYMQVVDNVKATDDSLDIIYVSVTPLYAGSDSGQLSNVNIDAFNEMLKERVKNDGGYYFDIATYMKGADGTLKPEYSGDNFVHENNTAYLVWEEKLKEFVKQRIAQD